MKNFGLERVIEPKNSMPVAAWKLDNSPELRKGELRVALKSISIERDSFNQICSICGYNEDKIRERILKIVSERGKMHNPYTGTGALFTGIIDEIDGDYPGDELKKGDTVICVTSITGLPLKITDIGEIDMQYARISCEGHAICFEATHLIRCDDPFSRETLYLVRTLEEEGNFYGMNRYLCAMDIKRAVIIGSNLVEAVLYASLIRHSAGADARIVFAADKEALRGMDRKSAEYVLEGLIDKVHYSSLDDSVELSELLLKEEKGNRFDAVINLETIRGCDGIATLIVRDKGLICYTSINNSYSQDVLMADCLGKEVMLYALDGFNNNSYDFGLKMLEVARPYFERLDSVSRKSKKTKSVRDVSRTEKLAMQQIDDFIYMSPVTGELVDEVINVAQYDCNVIIQGETGSGKEKIFDLIHQNSTRRGKPCIKINCATVQESLAESEFFGYEKGSFTGAGNKGKEGYFELANNGTLFLDEIGSLSLVMQSKLLRAIQENSYYRVGGTEPKHVNVRVVCANNVPLKKLVDEGKFREDLYYRLNICLIEVPPLRERKEDIYALSNAFIRKYCIKYGREKELTPQAHRKLADYSWPGNVRELENTIHRMYIGERGHLIGTEIVDSIINEKIFDDNILDLKREMRKSSGIDFTSIMEEQEKKLIEYALKKEKTTRKAAEFLNLPQTTLARKKLKHGL